MKRTDVKRLSPDRHAITYGPLPASFGYQLRRAYSYLYRSFIAELRELKLAPGQYSALVLIGANPGLSQIDLAEAVALDSSTIVPITDRFLRLGWIRRSRRKSDRRVYVLRITPLGQQILRKAAPIIAKREARLASILGPEERRALLEILTRITAAAREVPRPRRRGRVVSAD
jgi:DNA-binding MarR family transcriptional regulator